MSVFFRKFILASTLCLGACAHSIHQVNVSDFEPYKPLEAGRMVKAESEQFVVMSMTRNTNYVETAYRKLQAACEGGIITGISTQYSTSLGFFSWTNKILMQGLCLSNQASAENVNSGSMPPANGPGKKKPGIKAL